MKRLLAVVFLSLAAASAAAQQPPMFETRKLTDNAFIFRYQFHQALFIEPNPTGVKYALSVLGRISDDVRLPLVKVSEPTRNAIRSAMVHAGLIN